MSCARVTCSHRLSPFCKVRSDPFCKRRTPFSFAHHFLPSLVLSLSVSGCVCLVLSRTLVSCLAFSLLPPPLASTASSLAAPPVSSRFISAIPLFTRLYIERSLFSDASNASSAYAYESRPPRSLRRRCACAISAGDEAAAQKTQHSLLEAHAWRVHQPLRETIPLRAQQLLHVERQRVAPDRQLPGDAMRRQSCGQLTLWKWWVDAAARSRLRFGQGVWVENSADDPMRSESICVECCTRNVEFLSNIGM